MPDRSFASGPLKGGRRAMDDELADLARTSLRLFAQTIAQLSSGEPFDLLVGPGDSGAAMLRLTTWVYELQGRPVPPAVAIPLVRYNTQDDASEGNRFDNRVLLPELKSQLASVSGGIERILFVDDEVEVGMAVKATAELLSEAIVVPRAGEPITLVVVAEDHGFEGLAPEHARALGLDLQFRPFRRGTKGVYHVLPHLVPSEARAAIAQALWPESISPKKCFNLLLGLPTKHLRDKEPEFSYRYNELVRERVPGFGDMERCFAAEVREILRQGAA